MVIRQWQGISRLLVPAMLALVLVVVFMNIKLPPIPGLPTMQAAKSYGDVKADTVLPRGNTMRFQMWDQGDGNCRGLLHEEGPDGSGILLDGVSTKHPCGSREAKNDLLEQLRVRLDGAIQKWHHLTSDFGPYQQAFREIVVKAPQVFK